MRVVETDSSDTFKVSGRGELHLSILIETMQQSRTMNFRVSRPTVIYKTINGKLCEPMELLMIEVPDHYGRGNGKAGLRKAELLNMGTRETGHPSGV